LAVNDTGTTTYTGNITGGTTFTKNGAGSLTLAPTTSFNYTGATAITAGSLILGANNVLPSTTTVTLSLQTGSDGSNLNLNGFNQTLAGLTFFSPPGATTAALRLGAGKLTLNGNINYVYNSPFPGDSFPVLVTAATGGGIDLGGAVRNINIAGNNNPGGDLQINAPLSNGGIFYTGTPSAT